MASIMSGGDLNPLLSATAEDRARANEFFRNLQFLQQQYQQALQQQSALGRSYDQVIAGTAPSVAQTQLRRGVDETGAAVRAEAAGAGGNNAAMANYGAIQALAQARARANADAAALRAREVEAARQGKAGVLNNMQQATASQFSPTIGAGVGLSGQSTSGAGVYGGLDAQEAAAQRAFFSNLAQGAGSAIMTGATA